MKLKKKAAQDKLDTKKAVQDAKIALEKAKVEAEKVAQAEKAAQDKAKAKAKKERQKQNKQVAEIAAQQAKKAADEENALLEKTIEENLKIELATSQAPVVDNSELRRGVARDLIKHGYKGDRLKLAMLDHDFQNLHILKEGQIDQEQNIPKFLDLFEDLLKLPLSESEQLLHETLETIVILYRRLNESNRDLSSYTQKKDAIAKLIGTKLGQVERACASFTKNAVEKERNMLDGREKFIDIRLQLMKRQLEAMNVKKDENEIRAFKIKIDGSEAEMKQLVEARSENNRKCKMIFIQDVLQNFQSPAGPFPIVNQPLPVATMIGRLLPADLEDYYRKLEQCCADCIKNNGKIDASDIQPVVLDILNKTALRKHDAQEMSNTMTTALLANKDRKHILTPGLKQGLFNLICTQNKKAGKDYDVNVAADLTDIHFILIKIVQQHS